MHILAPVLLVFISFTIDLTDEYRGRVKARSNGMGEMWTTQNHNVNAKGRLTSGEERRGMKKIYFLYKLGDTIGNPLAEIFQGNR